MLTCLTPLQAARFANAVVERLQLLLPDKAAAGTPQAAAGALNQNWRLSSGAFIQFLSRSACSTRAMHDVQAWERR